MRTAIVKRDTLDVLTTYPGAAKVDGSGNISSKDFGGLWLNRDLVSHVEYDESMGDQVKAEEVDGTIVISADSEMIRNSKLQVLRAQRDVRLRVADTEMKKVEDSDPTAVGTMSDWKNYRIGLRSITDNYKYANDDNKGKSTLDSYSDDMSDFDQWPVKPS